MQIFKPKLQVYFHAISCYISSKIQCTDSLIAANEHVLSAAPFALQQYFSNLRLVIYFFPISPIKQKLGLQNLGN